LEASVAEALAISAAETAAKARGFGALPEHQLSGRVDTSEEIRALFAFMQGRDLNIPPEFTALIARYGGEGAP
jgi:hypothetical protein